MRLLSFTIPRPAVFAKPAHLEIVALCAFAFVLPQFEAPKNALWLVYIVLWISNRCHARNFGGPWDTWDSLIFAWISSGYVCAAFSGLHNAEWASAADVLRYGSVLWCVRRSGYKEETFQQVITWLLFGTLAALLRGYYELHFNPRADGQRRYLGLNSVGHVNHSAIYLAIALGVAVSSLLAWWRSDSNKTRTLRLGVSMAFGLSLFVMESRATVGVSFLLCICLFTVFLWRGNAPIWKPLVGGIVVLLVIGLFRPEVVEKNSQRIKEDNLLAARENIWRTGFAAWREFPAFGVGIGNYGKIDYEHLEQWKKSKGETLDRSLVLPQSHAHSLYVNTLAERGATGLLVLLLVLGAWARLLWKTVPSASESPIRWTFWGGSLSAWLVAVLVGLVNTTLHHEHALISMLLLGGWLSLSRPPLRNIEVRP